MACLGVCCQGLEITLSFGVWGFPAVRGFIFFGEYNGTTFEGVQTIFGGSHFEASG